MEQDETAIAAFKEVVWEYYAHHGRGELPWRKPASDGTFDPYKIMVSELMLQQTQVRRVLPKFETFVTIFPDVRTLAAAPLGDILRAWQGLGYNRRAKFLWQAAQKVVDVGSFPATPQELIQLPGVGVNTAGAIMVYAYNQPTSFIETNIRTVYIHHFFADKAVVYDKEIMKLVVQTLDAEQPRDWYWALMDYGTFLKTSVGNVARVSKQFTRQSTFKGSRRQVRGQVITLLSIQPQTRQQLSIAIADQRLESVLSDLCDEGFIHEKSGTYTVD